VLEKITSSPVFNDISSEKRFETYRMIVTMYIKRLYRHNHPKWLLYTTNGTVTTITKIIVNLTLAETTIREATDLSNLKKFHYIAYLSLPILISEYDNVDLFLGNENGEILNYMYNIFIERVQDMLDKAYDYLNTSEASDDNVFLDYVTNTLDIIDSIRESVPEEFFIYSSGPETYYEGNWHHSSLDDVKADELLKALQNDDEKPKKQKINQLLREIGELGYGPSEFIHYKDTEDNWRKGCIVNVDKAKKYMDYINTLFSEDIYNDADDPYKKDLNVYYRQSIILTCCKGDTKQDTLKPLIDRYYFYRKPGLIGEYYEDAAEDVEEIYATLNVLGFHDIAEGFINEGISLLENEILEERETEVHSFYAFNVLIILGLCKKDKQLIKRYTDASITVLEELLNYNEITPELRFEILESLIKHVERINDNAKIIKYKDELQELLDITYEIKY
jgi:hypothetical protein